jgi:uncharacterized protein (TIGR00255 family)
MTGFGAARPSSTRYAVETEIRSLNNRYLKVRIHAPAAVSILEPEIENFIRGRLSRGAVDVWIRVTDLYPAEGYKLDLDLVRRYREFADGLARELGASGRIEVKDMLMLPGVVSDVGGENEVIPAVKDMIFKSLDEALSDLERMRSREGDALVADIRKCAALIGAAAAKIRARSPEVVKGYRDRLLARVRELLAGSTVEIAEEDILKEVSIFAERSDISEELVRIDSHLEQLEHTFGSDGDVGRKVEFVAQELHREVNTIGSKANDAAISRLVVDAKGEVDRIREQAANLE